MKDFAQLFTRLDQTNSTNAKVDALVDYFDEAAEKDKLWTMALLSHRRPRRTVNTTLLRTWAAEAAGINLWLFEDSYHVVGDLAETITLLLPDPEEEEQHSLTEWIHYIRDLKDLEEAEKKEGVQRAWRVLPYTQRFVFNKLITGGFRMGVSQKLMTRALARHADLEESAVAHRLMGDWSPDDTDFQSLLFSNDPLDDISKPYPFYLAYPLEDEPEALGDPTNWQIERKWDGIRGQLLVREDHHFVWSRGEELITNKFPEYEKLAAVIPDGTVLDGEILPFQDGQPLPFQHLQRRIGRKRVTKKILQEVPVIFMAYDVLEWEGKDVRSYPMTQRRIWLEELCAQAGQGEEVPLILSPLVTANDWSALAEIRAQSREHRSEGLMLKRKNAPYKAGRKRGDWWKWKVEPLVIDAIMLYAQRGHGRRANLYTDYTFAVWNAEGDLVPFTKAYSGLTDKEFREITAWVRKNTRERFGPVRSVKPELVFEIAFEGIQKSSRHKSGVALRFPRMKRWRKDKPVEEANTLADLQRMLEKYG